MKSNCLIEAIKMIHSQGGKLGWEKSQYYWGPHFWWITEDGTEMEFIPYGEKHKITSPPWRFNGYWNLRVSK